MTSRNAKEPSWNTLNVIELKTFVKRNGRLPYDTPDSVKEDYYMMLWLTKVNFNLFSSISLKLTSSLSFCEDLARALDRKELTRLVSSNPGCIHMLIASARFCPDILNYHTNYKIWYDRVFLKNYIENGGIELDNIPDKLSKNANYMLFLISIDGSTFRFADDSLKNSISFCKKAKNICKKFTPIQEDDFFEGNLLSITYTQIEQLFKTWVLRVLKLE